MAQTRQVGPSLGYLEPRGPHPERTSETGARPPDRAAGRILPAHRGPWLLHCLLSMYKNTYRYTNATCSHLFTCTSIFMSMYNVSICTFTTTFILMSSLPYFHQKCGPYMSHAPFVTDPFHEALQLHARLASSGSYCSEKVM